MMTRILIAGLAVVLLGGAAGAAPDFDSLGAQTYSPPKPAPEFTLPDLNGRQHTLAELRGKVVMLYFWATW